MQDQPICGAPAGAPSPGSPEHDVQRQVLLELVTTPPPEGDELGQLAFALREPRRDVEAAVEALVDAGLVERDGDTVRATAAALRFDALWPIRA
jgi:hypothetical protein